MGDLLRRGRVPRVNNFSGLLYCRRVEQEIGVNEKFSVSVMHCTLLDGAATRELFIVFYLCENSGKSLL